MIEFIYRKNIRMKEAELKLSWRSKRPWEDDDPTDVTIEFKSVSKLRNFINNNERIFKIHKPYSSFGNNKDWGFITFRLIKIIKIKNTSIDATVQKFTLRDYNLDVILEGI